MSDRLQHLTYLHHFHRLLRRLRDTTPLAVIAARSGLDVALLRSVETGRQPVDEAMARQVLDQGFELDGRDVDRLIVGVRLYDLGLRDNAIRSLVTDVILDTIPASYRRQVRRVYASYTSLGE